MTDEEIDVVAEELAKVGGASWYPGRTRGPLLRALTNRFRDRARVAIAALDRLRASKEFPAAPISTLDPRVSEQVSAPEFGGRLQIGSHVVYRPPGDQRAVICSVEKIVDGRAYLVPCPRPDIGWISLDDLSPLEANQS